MWRMTANLIIIIILERTTFDAESVHLRKVSINGGGCCYNRIIQLIKLVIKPRWLVFLVVTNCREFYLSFKKKSIQWVNRARKMAPYLIGQKENVFTLISQRPSRVIFLFNDKKNNIEYINLPVNHVFGFYR